MKKQRLVILGGGESGVGTALLGQAKGYKVFGLVHSVDPERDTPELLRDFTDNLHPRMLGLTGTEAQILAASKAYRTYFKKQEPDAGDEDYYLIDHSTFTYLVLPEDGFVEFFRREVTPEQMADRVQCFLDAG